MMMEEVIVDSYMEDIPINFDMDNLVAMDIDSLLVVDSDNFVASSFDEELSNMSVPSSDVGIEASDLGSLLEQFEEVSSVDFGDFTALDALTDSVVPDIEKEETIISTFLKQDTSSNTVLKQGTNNTVVKQGTNNTVVKQGPNNTVLKPGTNNTLLKQRTNNIVLKPETNNNTVLRPESMLLYKQGNNNGIVKPETNNAVLKTETSYNIHVGLKPELEPSTNTVLKQGTNNMVPKPETNNNTVLKPKTNNFVLNHETSSNTSLKRETNNTVPKQETKINVVLKQGTGNNILLAREPDNTVVVQDANQISLLKQISNKISLLKQQTTNSLLKQESNTSTRNASTERKELTQDLVSKIKPAPKQKTAVMLPLVVPAKRGRGRAMTRGHPVALPAGCTPARLQRVMMQHQELSTGLPEIAMETVKEPKVKKKDDTAVLDENYFELIVDHDYTKMCSSTSKQHPIETGPAASVLDNKEMCSTVSKQQPVETCSALPAQDSELSLSLVSHSETIECNKSASTESIIDSSKDSESKESIMESKESDLKVPNVDSLDLEEEMIENEYIQRIQPEAGKSRVDRQARPAENVEYTHDVDRQARPAENVEYTHDGQFFDKLPTYCTALSIPRKSTRKTASHVAAGRGGLSVHDYIERDRSPVRDSGEYNKLPDYHSSFLNSTKYDTMSSAASQESKDSSGYSSVSLSPSRRSRSLTPEQGGSPAQSLSRSRSRHSHSRSYRKRSRRLSDRRQSSYSPCSGYSSSRSRSCSRSCSRSSCRSSSVSSRGSSSSSYCSTCDSRSSSCGSRSRSRSPSMERRAWQRETRLRGQRSRPPRSRSRSRSRGHYRSPSRSRSHYRRDNQHYSRDSYRSRSRSCSRERGPDYERRREEKFQQLEERRTEKEQEKKMQMKERRIVYVGGLPEKYTKYQLRSKFGRFGDIENVQLHFREHGDNYGFVTFAFTCDAYAAIEKGNAVPGLEKFDLCFGGRRQFCDVEYADLDGNKEVEEEFDEAPKTGDFDFDELLRQARMKLKK